MMSNTDLLAPNVSFIFAQKLKRTVRDFGNLVPDLVVEIKSKTDRGSKLEDQLKLFLELGAKVAILINSDELIVNLYHPDGKITLLTEDDQLTLTELFPGWEIAISELSPPVFE